LPIGLDITKKTGLNETSFAQLRLGLRENLAYWQLYASQSSLVAY